MSIDDISDRALAQAVREIWKQRHVNDAGVVLQDVLASAAEINAAGPRMLTVSESDLLELTEGLADHPLGWDGPCNCMTCRDNAMDSDGDES